MVAEQKIKGPASYFPSIEMKYGQPIEHWIKLVQKQKDKKHMEVVNWLKTSMVLATDTPMPSWRIALLKK